MCVLLKWITCLRWIPNTHITQQNKREDLLHYKKGILVKQSPVLFILFSVYTLLYLCINFYVQGAALIKTHLICPPASLSICLSIRLLRAIAPTRAFTPTSWNIQKKNTFFAIVFLILATLAKLQPFGGLKITEINGFRPLFGIRMIQSTLCIADPHIHWFHR